MPEPASKEDLVQLEKRVDLKLSSLRAWGVAALLGGQALAGVLAALVAPRESGQVVSFVIQALPFL